MSAIIIGSGNNVDKHVLNAGNLDIEYVICADGGLNKAEQLGLIPNIIIGDLDSVAKPILKKYIDMGVKLLKYPAEKDFTDMELSIEHAIEKGYKDIVLIGASGSRMDHTVANIMLIEAYYNKGINLKLLDNNNSVQIVTDKMKVANRKNYYVSIVPVTDIIEGITLIGFKYPLDNVNVNRGSTLCISNQIIAENGIIKLKAGHALVFISKD